MRKIPLLATLLPLTLACTLNGCGGDDNGQSANDASTGEDTGALEDSGASGDDQDAIVLGQQDSAPAGDDDSSVTTGDDDDHSDASTGGDDDDAGQDAAPGTDAGHADAGDAGHSSDGGDASDAGDAAAVDASDAGAPADAGADANDATVGGGGESDGGIDAGDAAAPFDAALPVDAGPVPTVFVVRVGDGTTTLSNASVATFLDEYPVAAGASPLRSIALPTAVTGTNNPITLSGTATSEGQLQLSVNGRYVTLGGFSAGTGVAAIASTSSVASDGGVSYPRVVARVGSAGDIDTSTLLPDLFSGSDVRSVVSTDGNLFWVAGVGGVEYVTDGLNGAESPVVSTPSNVRGVNIIDGQLYVSSGSSPYVGISSVGTGTPTSADTVTLLQGFAPDADGGDAAVAAPISPYAFIGFDTDATPGIDLLYIGDTPSSGVGGVQKWTLDGGVWSKIAETALGTKGVIGLTGFSTLGVVTLVATTTESPARLVSFVDDGVSAPIVIASSPTKTYFRGVALSPSP